MRKRDKRSNTDWHAFCVRATETETEVWTGAREIVSVFGVDVEDETDHAAKKKSKNQAEL